MTGDEPAKRGEVQVNLWKTFVYEATYQNEKENPIVKLCICRNCGAIDNVADPNIPDEFAHRVDAESCERCGHRWDTEHATIE